MLTNDHAQHTGGLNLVYLRNDFYKTKYRWVLSLLLLCLIVVGFLMGMIIYLAKHPPEPLFFVTDDVGRLITEVPLNQPNVSVEEAARYAVDAVEAAYSYDFVNYRSELQSAQKYFTDYGWNNYMEGLRLSNNLLGLTNRKMVVIGKSIGIPKLIAAGLLGGYYSWKFEINLLVTNMLPPFPSPNDFQNALVVDVVVQHRKMLESYKGLGVLQMIGRLATNASTPTISPTQS